MAVVLSVWYVFSKFSLYSIPLQINLPWAHSSLAMWFNFDLLPGHLLEAFSAASIMPSSGKPLSWLRCHPSFPLSAPSPPLLFERSPSLLLPYLLILSLGFFFFFSLFTLGILLTQPPAYKQAHDTQPSPWSSISMSNYLTSSRNNLKPTSSQLLPSYAPAPLLSILMGSILSTYFSKPEIRKAWPFLSLPSISLY